MGHCVLTPKVTVGDKSVDSFLYRETERRANDRPLTNLVYASYLQPGVAAKLDEMGKKRNKQGQHRAVDVWDFFEVTRMQNEKTSDVKSVEGYRVKDDAGTYIVYPFSEGAKLLDAVHTYNSGTVNNKKGTIAILTKRENGYSIITDRRNSHTQKQVANIRRGYRIVELVKALLQENGFNLDEMLNDPNIAPYIDITNIKDFFNILNTANRTHNKYLGSKLIAALLSLNKTDPRIDRLKKFFGVSSIEDLSTKIVEALKAPANAPIVSNERLATINDLLDTSKKDLFKGKKYSLLDIVNQIHYKDKDIVEFDEEFSLLHTIEELNEKFNTEDERITINPIDIKSLKEYVEVALRNLRHEASEIEKLEGITPKTQELYAKAQELYNAIEGKQFYGGCLMFLEKMYKDLQEIDSLYREYNKLGNNKILETLNSSSKLIMSMHSKIEAGINMIEYILKRPKVFLEGGINTTELAQLRDLANKLLPAYTARRGIVDVAASELFENASMIVFGEEAFDMATGQISSHVNKKGTVYDFFYSMSEMDDPHLAVLGSIMRRQSDKKGARLAQIKRRIDIENRKLVKARGSRDTSFMYEEDGHIISDIDWHAYNKARVKYKREMENHGLTGIALKIEMESWENANLEDRVVDQKSGRTERVPNSNYRKEFPRLSPAQKDYYDAMMQIKGELGTLLPEEARRQFQPPQIRRKTWDALKAAVSEKDKTTYWEVITNGFGDIFTVREDDTEFTSSGILVDGEELSTGKGDITGKEEKKVPIYYVNKISNKKELITDFSSALLQFASSAIQYDLTMEIRDTAEVLKMYIVNKKNKAKDMDGKAKVEVWQEKRKTLLSYVHTESQVLTDMLANDMVDFAIYGKQLKGEKRNTKLKKLGLAANSLLNLGLNVFGAAANVTTGEANALIEAGAGEFFNLKDYALAKIHLMALLPTIYQKVADLYTDTVENKDSLLSTTFDPFADSFDNLHGANRYNYSFVEKILSNLTALPLYEQGEWLLRKSVMYAVLEHEKVLYKGKKISLYQALFTTNKEFGEAELRFKEGVTDLKGNPLTSMNSEYIEDIKRKVRAANSSIHGAMNREDKGMLHRFLLGRAIMQFRQWMVAFYGKRFRTSAYWDDNMKKMRRGYYINTFYQLKELSKIREEGFKEIMKSYWKEAGYDVRRVVSDCLLVYLFHFIPYLLLSDDDEEESRLVKSIAYFFMRTESELKSGNPFYVKEFFPNIMYIINNPLPQTRSLTSVSNLVGGILNGEAFEGMGEDDYWEKNEWAKELKKGSAPYKQWMRLTDEEALENLLNQFDTYKEIQGETTAIPMTHNGKALSITLADGNTYPMYLHKITKGENVNKWTVYVERVSEETGEPYKQMLENGIELAAKYREGEDITTEGTRQRPRRPERPKRPKRPKRDKEYRISAE